MIFFSTEFDDSEFDPFSQQNNVGSIQENGQHAQGQPVDLLGDLDQGFTSNEYSNGLDNKHVSFDQDAGIGLPNPSFFGQGEGQGELESQGHSQKGDLQRNMSEGEILGYQNEYGGSVITGQSEYLDDNGEADDGTDIDHVNQGQGEYSDQFGSQVVPQDDVMDNYDTQNVDPSQDFYDDNVENDYVDNGESQGQYEDEAGNWHPEMTPERSRRSETPERSVDPGEGDGGSWQPDMTPERSRRSGSPERSMTPGKSGESQGGAEDSDSASWQQEMTPDRSRRPGSPERSMSPGYAESQGTETDASSAWQPELLTPDRSRRSLTPERSMSPGGVGQSESYGEVESDTISSPSEIQGAGAVSEPLPTIPFDIYQEPKSQMSLPLSSETESLDSRSETEGTPKRSRIKIPRANKKNLPLPPWDDNVVIPPPARIKPTMIGKQADLPPPAPMSPLRRPKTAPPRQSAKG